jgi:hypothetical protein
MAEEDEARKPDLEQKTKEQNSNLRRLIDTVGGLLTSSRELLTKLHTGTRQGQAEKARPADKAAGKQDTDDDPPSGPARS